MSNLAIDINNLKDKYREVFLKICENFKEKLDTMSASEFLNYLKTDAIKEVSEKQALIKILREKCNCAQCATCCNFAVSEYSPEELSKKAKNGDKTSQEFLETFIPYKNEQEAQAVFPEYFELIKEEQEKVYFYHCPRVTQEGKCPIYNERPKICREFPDNPISLLPPKCSFNKWKNDSEQAALELYALISIIDFYKEKLK